MSKGVYKMQHIRWNQNRPKSLKNTCWKHTCIYIYNHTGHHYIHSYMTIYIYIYIHARSGPAKNDVASMASALVMVGWVGILYIHIYMVKLEGNISFRKHASIA